MKHEHVYVVAVDMGYGHQRAGFPLLSIATTPPQWNIKEPMIIAANNYPGIAQSDKIIWDTMEKRYNWFSKMTSFPLVGKIIFGILDFFQTIEQFYPKRDLSKPTAQLQKTYRAIHKGFGKDLIDTLNKKPLPFVATFFTAAFFAEEHGYAGDIYCLCTDTDISRAWAPLNPETSRITYLAPTRRVQERLQMYGVNSQKIIVTGFPLPEELIGTDDTDNVLLKALSRRIIKLDPRGIFEKKFNKTISAHCGKIKRAIYDNTPITITFAIGGAGAQSEIGIQVLSSLSEAIKKGAIKINLVAGSSKIIKEKFEEAIEKNNLKDLYNNGIQIIYNQNKFEYFKEFDMILQETDLLWTKPSELSFYAGLGLPIIMAPTVGSQETFNKSWLQMIGAGFQQDDSRYTHQWLFDWINSGLLAEGALDGYLNGPKHGTKNIINVVTQGTKTEIQDIHFL
ncbi:MAG: hypothetical protein WC757_01075 [Candidatus Paceibacterota bacterium]|jgi:hypothetical protein